ncbi:hypothetical protein BN1723_014708 [Verticillium longisporum]|uniref:Uncharacterized protein n=1 Tax=Verticillium longisporum TaxID=100787 RepID=A0A0G4MFF5_VERLO|nr:hypothetical protein BN1708_013309 [Verticillium longisporum]CRK33018.1 hypothetical protein BN1723_014708 [Verticillium longisporum]
MKIVRYRRKVLPRGKVLQGGHGVTIAENKAEFWVPIRHPDQTLHGRLWQLLTRRVPLNRFFGGSSNFSPIKDKQPRGRRELGR